MLCFLGVCLQYPKFPQLPPNRPSPSPDGQVGIAQHGGLLRMGGPHWEGWVPAVMQCVRDASLCFSAAVKPEHQGINVWVKRTWTSREMGKIIIEVVLGLCPSHTSCRTVKLEDEFNFGGYLFTNFCFLASSPLPDLMCQGSTLSACPSVPALSFPWEMRLNFLNWQTFCSNSSCGGNASGNEVLHMFLLPAPDSPGASSPCRTLRLHI